MTGVDVEVNRRMERVKRLAKNRKSLTNHVKKSKQENEVEHKML